MPLREVVKVSKKELFFSTITRAGQVRTTNSISLSYPINSTQIIYNEYGKGERIGTYIMK